MKYFSMFSGIGGFEYGISTSYKQLAEIEQDRQGRNGVIDEVGNDVLSTSRTTPLCVGYSEVDKYAKEIYAKHWGHKDYGDCTKIKWEDVEDFEVLVGGFPCQAFSIAGKRGGFSDTRGTLFFEIARAVREKQPRLLVLENVKGLLSHDKGATFATILTTLDELGYDVQWQVLNSKNFGVPQNRERVFIIGHLRGTSRPEVFPIGASSGGNNEKQLQREEADERGCLQDAKDRGRHTLSPCLNANDSRKGYSGQNKQFFKNTQMIRRLTPTECERLQGFPDGWTEGISDTQRYKCLGNAVTTNVITAIFRRLI